MLEIEHDGRLDQMRLAGRRPVAIAGISLAAIAGPWLLTGIVLIALSLLSGAATPATLLAVLSVAGVPSMLAAFSTTVTFARERIDPRIGVVGLAAVTTVIAIAGAEALRSPDRWTQPFAAALVVETIVIALCLRNLPHRIAHAPIHSAGAPRVPLPFRKWLRRWPGVYRGASLSASGLMLFTLFAPVAVLVWIIAPQSRGQSESAGLYLPPLVIGVIAISLICREDAISGRLDLVRQSSTRVAAAGLQMLIGLWAPFVAASLGLAILSAALFVASSTGLLVGLLGLVLLAPLPVLEGWSRLWPLTLTLPVAVTILLLSITGAWAVIGVVAAVVWSAVARMLGHPERATITGWLGVAVTGAVCAVPLLALNRDLFPPGLIAACALFALSPILIDPGREDRLDRWGKPAAILVTTVAAVALDSGVPTAVSAAILPLALWHSARRSRQWNPARPAAQGAARLAILIASILFVGNYVGPRLDGAKPVEWPVVTLIAGALAGLRG